MFKVKIESLQAKEVQLEATALNVKLNDLQGRIGKDLLKKDVALQNDENKLIYNYFVKNFYQKIKWMKIS